MSSERNGEALGPVSLVSRVEIAILYGTGCFKERSLRFLMRFCAQQSVIVFSKYLEALVNKSWSAS